MRKILILAALLMLALNLFAQNQGEEAIQSLDTAKTLIQKGEFVKAQDEINFALAKINEILAEELLKYIPDAPAGFKLDDKQAMPMNLGGNSISASGSYEKDDSEITLTITVGGVMGQAGGLMGMANLFGAMGMAGAGKTIRINGYSGNQEYNKEESSGSLNIQVGSKITVMVMGENIENTDPLKTIAELVDMAKLEKAF